ncbi:DENN domain-containing protein 1B isoform X2 [Musca vetustissima]|uniref:DENN domain-containing protein 1B isoform X2 n=1 Tax=Musca vetustissima TaxID=27455 RepID=UPI002AB6976C|nr:DENN domain-containing protein 1B isoform X2 [Musca vetustissima]
MSSRNKTDVKKLFEYWCEVTRTHDGIEQTTTTNIRHNGGGSSYSGAPVGVITESFPESFRDEKTIHDIPAFAFPCEFESDSVQSYSFVLTTDDSKWRFGFCRHDPKTESTMVIITLLPWHDTFLKLLALLAELRRTDPKEFQKFLTDAYNSGVPGVGSPVKLFYSQDLSPFIFERPKPFQLPSIPENHNLNLYYNFVDPKNMIAVFAAMLAERRIIFTSRRLDRLSSCIQAANAFLYPMVWQHIFIPVLPMKLKDYLSAPMPYLIGVPHLVLETMTPEELGEVVTLNCDTKIFDSPFDDVHAMPAEIVSQLKKQLSHSHQHMGDRVSKIFLGVLVQLIGGYRDAVEFRETGKTFNREKFIESRPSHLRPFLTKMMELQIFQQFIDERLEMMNTGLGFSDEFEQETVRYAEKLKKRGRFYQLKEKTNPAVKSAVKSVKESSRVAKHAYKDLKSKLRDITPPNPSSSSHLHHNHHNNNNFRSHLNSNTPHDRLDGVSVGSGYVTSSSGNSKDSSKSLKTYLGRHSAPSSPVFCKRIGSSSAAVFQYAPKDQISNASQHLRRGPTALAMSNSSTHIQSNGYAKSSPISFNHNHHLASSPTISPASSLCSSEMNLSQELQNHPLFKSPIVDRSPQHMTLGLNDTTTTTIASANTTSTDAGSHSNASEESMKDLISLDDSHNSSFDLEDFDPLNQNARPLPPLGGKVGMNSKSTTLPATATSRTTPSHQQQHQPTASFITAANNSISNPLYTFYTPQHMATSMTAQQHAPLTRMQAPTTAATTLMQQHQPPTPPSEIPPPLPKSVPPPMPPPDEDFELLRKYGLDQFTLITTSVTATSTSATTMAGTTSSQQNGLTTTGMQNWTTFD